MWAAATVSRQWRAALLVSTSCATLCGATLVARTGVAFASGVHAGGQHSTPIPLPACTRSNSAALHAADTMAAQSSGKLRELMLAAGIQV